MEFKLYDNVSYKTFRDQSIYGKKDKSLEDVVIGILKFMKNQKIIDNQLK